MARILLDSNVWRHIVEHDAVEDLRRATRSGLNVVVIAPAVVYEALRTENRRLRHQLVHAMTRRAWTRLRPEAHEECIELLEEIRRTRPHWCLSKPDAAAYWAQRADWERARGFWHRVHTTPDVIARQLAMLEGTMMNAARGEARSNRGAAQAYVTFETIDLSKLVVTPDVTLRGWQGDPVKPWRLDALGHYTTTLVNSRGRNPTSATTDWLAPWIDMEAIRRDRTSWNQLFLYHLCADRMRRNWLRWAFRIVQATRRTTPGTPGDNQLSGYLTEADIFITADRGFAAMVTKVSTQAWFAVAAAVVVPGDRLSPPREVLALVAEASGSKSTSSAR